METFYMIQESILKLLNSNITSYQIEKETGVSRTTIGRLRNEKNKVSDLTLTTAEKLYLYQKKLENNVKES
ncbi:Trp family transcriptional regulator [Staphylococcus chromogenes]|uniref:Trp family transcriptional regulator n=1 Tax=Staphylococcus chromogenes TaxID=46126 RepID=UPI001F5404BF